MQQPYQHRGPHGFYLGFTASLRTLAKDSEVHSIIMEVFHSGERSVSVAAVKLRIQLCLKFSVMRPLSISIQGDQHQFRTEYPWGICAEIGRHTDRWRSLVFNAGVLNYALGGSALFAKQQGLRQLHMLHIHTDGMEELSQRFQDDIFVDAAALEEVELRNILSLPPANWSGVRKLIMDECELSLADGDSFSAFRNMSSLEELTWRKSYINRGPIPLSPQNLGEITLPLLHTLHIQPSRYFSNFLDWVPPVYIWSMLYVPSLTHIRITDNIPGLEFHSIMLMIQESGSIIKKLHLDRFSFSFFLTSVQELCDVEEFFLTKSMDNNMHTEDILALLIWVLIQTRIIFFLLFGN
ncbi:hypothetical protein BDQ17DRAFT_682261 [Cyathus striatus]|nr:hypothetical protein BDQ17DRAFT_682261 [Cyathus striatus]